MGITISVDEFIEKQNAKKLIGLNDDMEIVNAKGTINQSGLYWINDWIGVNNNRKKIVGFASKGEKELVAIVSLNKEKGTLLCVDLNDKKNYLNKRKRAIVNLLESFGLVEDADYCNYERGNIFATFNFDGTININAYKADGSFKTVFYSLEMNDLHKVLKLMLKKKVWDKCANQTAQPINSSINHMIELLDFVFSHNIAVTDMYFESSGYDVCIGDVIKGYIIMCGNVQYFLEVYNGKETFVCLSHYIINDKNVVIDLKLKMNAKIEKIINSIDEYVKSNLNL
jgi:hypothetical protein